MDCLTRARKPFCAAQQRWRGGRVKPQLCRAVGDAHTRAGARDAVLTAGRAAAAAALALSLTLGAAAPASAAVNSAVLKSLQKYQFERTDEVVTSRGTQAVQHMQGSLQQLERVVVLAQLGKYDAARLQLREGSFKTLRLDLGYGAEMYRVISQQSVRDAINQIEGLDRALKARADVEEVRQLTDALGAGIRRTAELLEVAEAERS